MTPIFDQTMSLLRSITSGKLKGIFDRDENKLWDKLN